MVLVWAERGALGKRGKDIESHAARKVGGRGGKFGDWECGREYVQTQGVWGGQLGEYGPKKSWCDGWRLRTMCYGGVLPWYYKSSRFWFGRCANWGGKQRTGAPYSDESSRDLAVALL